ncbi:hypothetical protein VTO73DRAFT_4956 [Trametes versicolor]
MQILLDGPSSSEESVRNSTADVAAVRATISAISTSGPSAESQGSPHSGEPFAVLSSTIDANGVAPSTRNYLRQLTRSANAAAASLACGSILAGHTSETDEYGDVAVWLGSDKYSPGHELDVLSLLGFETVAGPVKEVKLSSDTGLPTTVHSPAHPDPTVIHPECKYDSTQIGAHSPVQSSSGDDLHMKPSCAPPQRAPAPLHSIDDFDSHRQTFVFVCFCDPQFDDRVKSI